MLVSPHRMTLANATIVLSFALLLANPVAAAESICVLNCTAEVSLPPEPAVGVNVAGVSEYVYLYECTATFSDEACVRTSGALGSQGVYVVCPMEEGGTCFVSSGGQVPGGAGNVAVGFIPIVRAGQVCALTGASAIGTPLWGIVVCVPHDYTVDANPTSPSVCLAFAIEENRFAGPGPFRCVEAEVEDQPLCIVLVVDGMPVEVVCSNPRTALP